MIKIIWTNVHNQWLLRCKDKHGKDLAEQAQKRRTLYIDELSVYYQYRDNDLLMPRETKSTMFYNTIQEHLYRESTLVQLETWLCTYRDIVEASRRKAAISTSSTRIRGGYHSPVKEPVT